MHEQTYRTLSGILHVPTEPCRLDETTEFPVGPIAAFTFPIWSTQAAHEVPC